MIFSSLVFLFIFLPAAITVYYVSPRKLRNLILLIISLIFYAWGEPIYILLMIFSAIVDYCHGMLIEKYRDNKKIAKLVVISSVLINLGLLSFFKYADFLTTNLNMLLGFNLSAPNLPLPIGISFYTFQTMSYTIDVYRGEVPVQKNPIALATYVTLFPQLIAGPIVRYKTVSEQINNRAENVEQFSEGVRRFIIGLGKKVLLANNIGLVWTTIKGTGLNELTILTVWLGIICFSFQIYFDFCGYSDMAIGLGKMFGFDFLENFNYPYISQSITEFWRRWHISLGTWFKDYVYFPLGGSRGSKIKLYRNLFIVWFLTGFWHGASWNFIVWGLYFGMIIAIEKAGLLKLLENVWRPVRHFYALFLILIGWVLFEFDKLAEGIGYIKAMFGVGNINLYDDNFIYYFYTQSILLIVLIVASTPLIKTIGKKIRSKAQGRRGIIIENLVIPFMYLAILVTSTAYLVDASYNPFLYFRF